MMELLDIVESSTVALLDVDGCLIKNIKSRHIPTRTTFADALIERGLLKPSEREQALEKMTGPISTVWREFLDPQQISLSEAILLFGNSFIGQESPCPPYERAIESIVKLKQMGKTVAGVTASLTQMAYFNLGILQGEYGRFINEERLAGSLNSNVFDAYVADDSVFVPNLPVKPSFEFYKLVMDQLSDSGKPDHFGKPAFVVGDTGSDKRLAENISRGLSEAYNREVHVPFIYIKGEGHNRDLEKSADLTYENMAEFCQEL